jgi:hypothetical protein
MPNGSQPSRRVPSLGALELLASAVVRADHNDAARNRAQLASTTASSNNNHSNSNNHNNSSSSKSKAVDDDEEESYYVDVAIGGYMHVPICGAVELLDVALPLRIANGELALLLDRRETTLTGWLRVVPSGVVPPSAWRVDALTPFAVIRSDRSSHYPLTSPTVAADATALLLARFDAPPRVVPHHYYQQLPPKQRKKYQRQSSPQPQQQQQQQQQQRQSVQIDVAWLRQLQRDATDRPHALPPLHVDLAAPLKSASVKATACQSTSCLVYRHMFSLAHIACYQSKQWWR